MPTNLKTVVAKYLRSGNPAQRTREEYSTTVGKWTRLGRGVPLEEIGRKEIREFLDRVYEDAAEHEGTNPGRTANKVRSHLRAVLSWAWEQDMVEALPRFPKHKPQRNVAGRFYLTKTELNALYFATHEMIRPRGWNHPFSVDRYRHYAHRAPLAFKAITTMLQPSAFTALAKGFDGQCPCCRRRFNEERGSLSRQDRLSCRHES